MTDLYGTDPELVDVSTLIVLSVRNRRLQHFPEYQRGLGFTVHQSFNSPFNRKALELSSNQSRLLR